MRCYKDTIEADVRCLSSLKNAMPQVDTIINLAAEHKDNVKPKNYTMTLMFKVQ